MPGLKSYALGYQVSLHGENKSYFLFQQQQASRRNDVFRPAGQSLGSIYACTAIGEGTKGDHSSSSTGLPCAQRQQCLRRREARRAPSWTRNTDTSRDTCWLEHYIPALLLGGDNQHSRPTLRFKYVRRQATGLPTQLAVLFANCGRRPHKHRSPHLMSAKVAPVSVESSGTQPTASTR